MLISKSLWWKVPKTTIIYFRYNQDPPSYDQVQQGNTMYTKQPPYNPNYTGQ